MQASVKLQNNLTNIADTSFTWNWKFNRAKCVIMGFFEKSVTDIVASSIYGSSLLSIDLYKDLGRTIDSGLKFRARINAVIGKADEMIKN